MEVEIIKEEDYLKLDPIEKINVIKRILVGEMKIKQQPKFSQLELEYLEFYKQKELEEENSNHIPRID